MTTSITFPILFDRSISKSLFDIYPKLCTFYLGSSQCVKAETYFPKHRNFLLVAPEDYDGHVLLGNDLKNVAVAINSRQMTDSFPQQTALNNVLVWQPNYYKAEFVSAGCLVIPDGEAVGFQDDKYDCDYFIAAKREGNKFVVDTSIRSVDEFIAKLNEPKPTKKDKALLTKESLADIYSAYDASGEQTCDQKAKQFAYYIIKYLHNVVSATAYLESKPQVYDDADLADTVDHVRKYLPTIIAAKTHPFYEFTYKPTNTKEFAECLCKYLPVTVAKITYTSDTVTVALPTQQELARRGTL